MIIYGAFLLPFITGFILYRYFNHMTVWWEYFVPFVASLILIVSSKAIIEHVQVSSKEYWGSFIRQVDYYEDWNEYVHQTCYRTCCCDSKGENCQQESYDCSYVLYHPPYWQITTTTNEIVKISQAEYQRIKAIFGNEQFADLGRNYYTDDGDRYYCTWPGDSASSVPVTTLHHYENRVKAADQSVFHFGKISKADRLKFQLKEYPDITGYYKMPAVIGDSAADAKRSDRNFQYINALLGSKKEVRIFILIFVNQPVMAASYQEWYWSGGNMNEFIVCIGIDGQRNVKWCKPLSWTRNEMLKSRVKDFVQSQQKLDLKALGDYMTYWVDREFVRRDFKEFNYLTVEPPGWAVILTYFLTLAVNLGLSLWIIRNEAQNYISNERGKYII